MPVGTTSAVCHRIGEFSSCRSVFGRRLGRRAVYRWVSLRASASPLRRGDLMLEEGSGLLTWYPRSTTPRARVVSGLSNTIAASRTCSCSPCHLVRARSNSARPRVALGICGMEAIESHVHVPTLRSSKRGVSPLASTCIVPRRGNTDLVYQTLHGAAGFGISSLTLFPRTSIPQRRVTAQTGNPDKDCWR